jgi:hypothetical protein
MSEPNKEPEQKMPNVLERDSEKGEITIEEIIQKLLDSGQIIITGVKQTGKTNTAMHLMRALMNSIAHKNLEMRTVMFDTVLNWRYRYDSVQYLDIEQYRILPTVLDLIVDIGYSDSNDTRNAIGQIIMNDFARKRAMKEKFNGKVPYYDVYLIEEAQNCLGQFALTGEVGRFWLKIISECANYKMIFLFITQRLADVSTKVIERTRYFLLGATSGDNDLAKIRRMGGKKLADYVLSLKRGEFLLFDKDNKNQFRITFDLFTQNGKPYPYTSANGKSSKGYKVEQLF